VGKWEATQPTKFYTDVLSGDKAQKKDTKTQRRTALFAFFGTKPDYAKGG